MNHDFIQFDMLEMAKLISSWTKLYIPYQRLFTTFNPLKDNSRN